MIAPDLFGLRALLFGAAPVGRRPQYARNVVHYATSLTLDLLLGFPLLSPMPNLANSHFTASRITAVCCRRQKLSGRLRLRRQLRIVTSQWANFSGLVTKCCPSYFARP